MKAPKTFEDGLQRLQTILDTLQQENTPLDQAVKLYAEAAQLVQFCNETLQNARVQIEEIDLQLKKGE